jgi:hypothetical protein
MWVGVEWEGAVWIWTSMLRVADGRFLEEVSLSEGSAVDRWVVGCGRSTGKQAPFPAQPTVAVIADLVARSG